MHSNPELQMTLILLKGMRKQENFCYPGIIKVVA
jgi:hypothetical protein